MSEQLPPTVTADELQTAAAWVAEHLAGDTPPWSFIYGGQSSTALLPAWTVSRTARRLDEQRDEQVIRYSDPATGLTLRCVVVTYRDYPVVEWTIFLKNEGAADTPLIERLCALDSPLPPAGPGAETPILHYQVGSPTAPEDYRPLTAPLEIAEARRITTSGGRPCNSHLPYFNLAWPGGGYIVAIGWPGQWAATFTREDADTLRISAGQETTHFVLHPGEEIRTPLIALQWYTGSWIQGQNVWRRWMLAHNLPRPGGTLPAPQLCGGGWYYFTPWGHSNALAMKIFIDFYEALKIPIQTWWTDAGWYPCNDSWPNVGTWEPDPLRYPQGVRDVSDHAHAKGLRALLWFEPERVTPGSWLAEEHPEWLLAPPPNPGGQFYEAKTRMLDLGNSDALHWLIEHISALLTREGIDIYREDINFDPLLFWREHETADRRGIAEIKHIQGHLAYWDALRQRFPDMLLDTCASGGKRTDLESLRRAVPLWRSDHVRGDAANQGITYGMALWFPYFGAPTTVLNPYYFHSRLSPSMVFDIDPRREDIDLDLWRRLCAQQQEIAACFFGDYYPLTGYSLEEDAWIAWQFDCPEEGRGMVQAFRRAQCPVKAQRFRLQGLAPGARYAVTDLDTGIVRRFSGRTLLEHGLVVRIAAKPGSVLFSYRREE